MGLDAFLFPQEGVALSRQVGSSPWMYPSFPLDFNLKSFAQVRNEYGGYKACTMTQLFAKGGCQELYQLWEEHYKVRERARQLSQSSLTHSRSLSQERSAVRR